MTKSWGPHDVGGQQGGPVDMSEHDTAHWEWQIDAMVRLALAKGLISDKDLIGLLDWMDDRSALEGVVPTPDGEQHQQVARRVHIVVR